MANDSEQVRPTTKICRICGITKPLNYALFYGSPSTKDGFQNECKRCVAKINKLNYQDRKEEVSARNKNRRTTVLNHYGCVCACCGEATPEFLAVDHINNDGARHRKELGNHGGYHMYYWLIQNNFPPGFQLLCHNCNCAKAFYGECPHNKIKLKLVV